MNTPTTSEHTDHTYLAPAWAARSVRDRRAGTGYLCGAALGLPASSNLLDHGVFSLLPALLAGFALVVAFVWMTRRWGLRPSTTSGPATTRGASSATTDVDTAMASYPTPEHEAARDLVLHG